MVVADADGDSLTLTLVASAGTLAATSGGSVTVGGSGTGTLTLSGTAANINTFLDTASNVQYTGASNANGNDAATLTLTANDGTEDSADSVANLDITAVNDDPTVSGLVTDIALTEDTAGSIDLSASAFADVDSAGNITVTLTASEGTFSTPVDGSGIGAGVTETLVNATTVTLVGTVADINTYLNTGSNVQYTGATDDSGGDTATIAVTINDGDGSGDVAAGTVNLDITNVNDDPTVSGLVTDIAFTEDTVGNLDLSASAFADVDTTGNVTVTLTASEGTFSTPVDGSGVGAGVTETLVNATTVTLVGTVDDINTYLNTASNLQYTGATNDNGGDTSTVTVTINDGEGSGDVALGTVNLDITAVNDAPTAANNTITMDENTARVLTAADFNFADVDTGDTFISVRIDTLTLASGTFQLSGVDVSASDVISVGDISAGNLVYTPATNADGDDLLTLTFSVNDGTNFAAAPSAMDIDVTDVTVPVDTTPIRDRGTSGSDDIIGAGGNDTLVGGSGPDTVSGGGGDDQIWAGQGDNGADRVSGGNGDDTVGGGAGNDFIEGDDGSDVLYGGSGNDTIYATTRDNENGDTSDNIVWAGSGDDKVTGGLGADTLGGGSGGDNVAGGNGADVLYGGQNNDTLDGGGGDDTLFGGAGADTLDGGAGADLLFGGSGSDTVDGGTGNDTLWAGAGDDVLTGGADADTFVFGATSGNDTISDFDTSADTLDFSFSALADLAAVQAAASDANQGGQDGLLIDLGDGESVFLIGLDVADLASLTLTFG